MAEKKQNVVFWKDQGPDDIIYVSPDDDLRTITSVTVPEHSVALFIRDGQLQGVLEPGRHVTTSSNIPWLTALYNKALGFRETPFKCSVVFISLKIFNGKWGLRSMIKAAKEYEVPITLMANGDFQFRIQDVNVFYTQVLGGMKSYSTGDVNQFMKSFITEQLTQQLNSQYYMDVMSNLEKASTSTKILIDPYFQQRGIELLALKINEVSTTEAEKTKVFEYLQFSSANGEAFKRYEVMDRMADAIDGVWSDDGDTKFLTWAANVYASELLVWDCLNTCPLFAHGNEWRWLQQSAYTLSRQLEALDPAVAVHGTEIYEDIAPRDGAFL